MFNTFSKCIKQMVRNRIGYLVAQSLKLVETFSVYGWQILSVSIRNDKTEFFRAAQISGGHVGLTWIRKHPEAEERISRPHKLDYTHRLL